MIRITQELLAIYCDQPPRDIPWLRAIQILEGLGGLGRWALHPDVIAQAVKGYRRANRHAHATLLEKHSPPRLPQTQGACWVIVATEELAELPSLRPAFPLPLRWDCSRPHSDRLPASLRSLADDVLDHLGADSSIRLDSTAWGLQLPDECGLDDCDLSSLEPFPCASGWAALAAGLITAVEEGLPNPLVWASGAWDPQAGILPVGHVAAKTAAARDYGVQRLYLPPANLQDARQATGNAELEVYPLVAASLSPRKALAEYVANNKVRPGPSASHDACRRYYLHLRDPRRAEEFYVDRLLETIAAECREKLTGICDATALTHLVTIVSRRPAIIKLATRVIAPRECLLFYTDREAAIQAAEQDVGQYMEQSGVRVQPVAFEDNEELPGTFRERIERFAAETGTENLVLDLTPGTKWMTLAMSAAAPPGSWLIYWWHATREGDVRIIPGSERPFLWRSEAPGSPPDSSPWHPTGSLRKMLGE